MTKIYKDKKDENELIRLNKYLSDCGICSRREADRLVEKGQVKVNGQVAVMGQKVTVKDKVTVNGKEARIEEERIVIALNKPRGVECTTDEKNPDNIVDFVGMDKRIYPIGRLDKDSQGLILMTNDGAIVNHVLKASNFHEKEYLVTVDKNISEDFIEKMSQGVKILDTVTRPCKVKKNGQKTFTIVLTQGLNRQIRRMCNALGYSVVKLKRTRVMNINIGGIKLGEYRYLTEDEIAELMK